jgi:hypothetical protein
LQHYGVDFEHKNLRVTQRIPELGACPSNTLSPVNEKGNVVKV